LIIAVDSFIITLHSGILYHTHCANIIIYNIALMSWH